MSFISDVLPLLGSILAIILILFLTYIASKYISKKVPMANNGGNIRIVERMALAQDKFLAVIEISNKYYLIGVSSNNINLLKELDDYEPPKQENGDFDFSKVTKILGKKSNVKEKKESIDNE